MPQIQTGVDRTGLPNLSLPTRSLFTGYIFKQAVGFSPLIQSVLIFTPFAFLLLDVLSWWLTKWYPNPAVLTLIGGFGYTVASTVMLVTCLYQMWIMPLRRHRPTVKTSD